MREKVKKQIFLEDLPKKKYGNKEVIDWKKSIGYSIDFIYGDIRDKIKITDYKNCFIYVKYKDFSPYKISPDRVKLCQLEFLLKDRIRGSFKLNIGDTLKESENNRNITIIDKNIEVDEFNKTIKSYKYRCNECSYEGWTTEHNLTISKTGCACCDNKVSVLGINTIWDTDRWMIDLGMSEEDAKKYTKSSSQKITVECPDCGREKEIVIGKIYTRKSISCACGDGKSYPNKFAYRLFEQLGINFISEYSPEWCSYKFKNKFRQGKYDFYFAMNNNQYIMEMDGGFHNNDNSMNGQTVKESQHIDYEKDRLAKENNIEVIRIDCEFSNMEYIQNNVINSKLSELFDLSNINWVECEEFALKNRVKEICEYFNENTNITIIEIARAMKLGRKTVREYLKKGAKLGWCNYDINNRLRSIEIFKDGNLLDSFKSIQSLVNNSLKLFGVQLISGEITSVCKGKKKHHKGFTFKYVNQETKENQTNKESA